MLILRSVAQIFVLASVFTIFAGTPAHPQQMNRDNGSFEALEFAGIAEVEKVIDPLTVQLDNKEIVGLVGLDIPDFNPHAPGPISTLALTILKDYALGQQVRLYRTQGRNTGRSNRMGHKLYHLVREEDGGWVQGMLLSLGLARMRTVKDNPEMADAMLEKELEARKESIGLWDMTDYRVIEADNAQEIIDTFSVVQGKVLRAQRRPSRIYLNFGNNYKDDFTIQIRPSDLKAFRDRDIDPLALQGKTIEVRGWVKDYNGPYIEIDHPERLRVLEEQ